MPSGVPAETTIANGYINICTLTLRRAVVRTSETASDVGDAVCFGSVKRMAASLQRVMPRGMPAT